MDLGKLFLKYSVKNEMNEKESQSYDLVKTWIDEADQIVFFNGAGISVGAGVPTFRGKMGLWTFGKTFMKYTGIAFLLVLIPTFILRHSTLYPILYKLSVGLFVATVISPFLPWVGLVVIGTPLGWNFLTIPTWFTFKHFFFDGLSQAQPSHSHNFIAWVENFKKDETPITVITQNVDDLVFKSGFGTYGGVVHQLHGSFSNFYCGHCHERYKGINVNHPLPKLAPKCPKCGWRRVRTGCLLFSDMGNPLNFPFESAFRSIYKMTEKSLLFVVGTSGTVYPANRVPAEVHSQGSRIVEININRNSSFRFGEGNFVYLRGGSDDVFLKIKSEVLLAEQQEEDVDEIGE